MATYSVNVQGSFYKNFTFDGAYKLTDILAQIEADKASNTLTVDNSKPLDLTITPV
jgi:hypothetical protein